MARLRADVQALGPKLTTKLAAQLLSELARGAAEALVHYNRLDERVTMFGKRPA